MNISIVIPNYNGEEILKKNLPKVLEATGRYHQGSVEIIIADDCSSDNSVGLINEFIKKNKESNIKLLTNVKNQGFSSNVNKGARSAKGEILVLLNTDVIPSDNFLMPLVEHFKDKSVFGVGCMDESVENGKIIPRGRGIGKWSRGFFEHRAGSLDKNNTLWVAGGSGAFRKKLWDELGGLDELYSPFYWEDIDISYRALKSGYKCIFEKESVVRHEHEKGAVRSEYSATDIKKIAYRNQFFFVWKNADLNLLISHFFWLPYRLVNAILKDRLMLVGFFNAVLSINRVLATRRSAQKYFRISDKEVILEIDS